MGRILKKYPLLVPFIALCLGIILRVSGGEFSVDSLAMLFIGGAFAAALVIEIVSRDFKPLFWVLFMVIGYLLTGVKLERADYSVVDKKISAVVVPTSDFEVKGKWLRGDAVVIAYKEDSTVTGWKECDEMGVMLNLDSLNHSIQLDENRAERGDTLLINTTFREISGGYGRYLQIRGVLGQLYAYDYNLLSKSSDKEPVSKLEVYREELAERIYALDTLERSITATMVAMTLGDKSNLESKTVANYRDSGVAHLLAISGLHIGIIVVLLNLLFSSVKVIERGGRVFYSVLIILILWGYALFVGAAPSVMRAVVMFSLYQVAWMFSRSGTSWNVLFGSAVLLLLWNPLMLYDVGFQLSYAAMGGITLYYRALYSLLGEKMHWLWRRIWSVVAISLAAQMGAMPLVVYHFGDMAWGGVLVSLVVWVSVPLVLFSVFLYLASGVSFIGEFGVWVMGLQNRLFEWIGEFEWLVIRDIEMPLWFLIGIYILLLGLGLWFNRYVERRLRMIMVRRTQMLKV